MQYVYPVDLNAFRPNDFHSQFIARRENGLDSCICILTRVPPGKGTTIGLHVHPADQLYYVIKGTMTAQVGDQRFTVRPNQLLYIPAGSPHWNWNDGSEDEMHFELIVPSPEPGVPIATAVDVSVKGPDVRGVTLVRTLDESKFDMSRFSQVVLADRSSGVGSVSLGIFRVPPGGRGPVLHVHRFDQIYFILSGTMQLQIGLEQYTAGPNTLVVLPAGMPHTNWNTGPEVEYHINLRVPEPKDRSEPWDFPVEIGTEEARVP